MNKVSLALSTDTKTYRNGGIGKERERESDRGIEELGYNFIDHIHAIYVYASDILAL